MDREQLRLLLRIASWACFVPFVIMVLVYYKAGRLRPPVPLREFPKPLLVLGALALVFWAVDIWLHPPITDEEGFGMALWKLNAPEAHGLPLLAEPKADAKRIRLVKRFESFTTSNREQNGFIEVKMMIDDAIGWLDKDVAAPDTLKAIRKGFYQVSVGAKNLAFALFTWRVAIEVTMGLLLAGIIISRFGHFEGQFYNRRVDYAAMILSAIGAMFTKVTLRVLVPFSAEVARAEAAGAKACIMIRLAFPAIIASLLANLLFGRCDKAEALGELVLGIIAVSLIYVMYGMIAAWW